MIYGTLLNWCNTVNEYIANKASVTYMVIYDQTEVNYGFEDDCDIIWCRDNDIPCFNIKRSAGCCVSAAGSVNIADIRKHKGEFVADKLLPDFRDWLISKGVDAQLSHNDILVDDLKVASGCGHNFGDNYSWQYTGFQFSINQDEYVIEHACLKPRTKMSGSLSDYGITTDEVVKWCEEWFSDYDS